MAGVLSDAPWLAALFGDSVVPLRSATAGGGWDPDAALPAEHVKVVPGASHVGIAHHPGVYELIRAWCTEGVGRAR